MLLTKHENETFLNQTVYISGQAYINCTFVACTLVLRETVYHMQNCAFERCNWHVDWLLMWGSADAVREVKALVNLLEQAQIQQQIQAGGQMPAPMPMGNPLTGALATPFTSALDTPFTTGGDVPFTSGTDTSPFASKSRRSHHTLRMNEKGVLRSASWCAALDSIHTET